MNISKITSKDAKNFIGAFLVHRTINKDFYNLVPEEKFDFRMVETTDRKSDSVRESLTHQIDVTRDYVNGIINGELNHKLFYEDLKDTSVLSKQQLLDLLSRAEEDLINILSEPDIDKKLVKVPWNQNPIPAVASLWGMNNHEILHTGWNIAVMDSLNLPRFDSLKKMWG